MRIARIIGLPGDGKTALLTAVARKFSDDGYNVAAIANDIGHINLDQMIISSEGIVTKEMAGGCVCCGTESTFNTTMVNMYMTHHPDIILMEPIDIAASYEIGLGIAAASKSGLMLEGAPVVMVVDPRRIWDHLANVNDLFDIHIGSADVVFIGMSDTATPEEMDVCENTITSMDQSIPIIRGSSKDGTGLDEVMEIMTSGISNDIPNVQEILAEMEDGRMNETEMSMHRPMDDLGKFSAVLKFDSTTLGKMERSKLMNDLLNSIADACRDSKATIMHVKACMYNEGERDVSDITYGDITLGDIERHDNMDGDLVNAYVMVHTVVHGLWDPELMSVSMNAIEHAMSSNGMRYRILREFHETEKRVK